MKTSFQKALVRVGTAAIFATTAMAHATTLTFDGLGPARNGASVTAYSEEGYLIAATTGSLSVQQYIGSSPSGVPSLNVLRNASFALTGGTFTFDGFDGAFSATGSTFRALNVTGFLEGVQTFSTTISSPTVGFAFFDSGSGNSVFDRVVFSTGDPLGQLVIDNIRVTAALPVIQPPPVADLPPVAAVPEPGTYALMGLGLLGIGCIQRRRTARRGAASH